MQIIPISNLALVALPSALVIIILWRWSDNAAASVYALARMVIQLCLIGYALTFIFATNYPALVLAVLSIMLAVSSWIALRSIAERRKQLYFKALGATLVVNLTMLALITQCVLVSQPWYAPSVVIPLAGMLFAVAMNSISLFAERYFAELTRNTDANNDDSEARNTAYKATMIPITNSLLAVGLVSLPGMMTGQILSGISPLIAVRYQIMVMLMLFASTGLTAALFYYFIRPSAHITTSRVTPPDQVSSKSSDTL